MSLNYGNEWKCIGEISLTLDIFGKIEEFFSPSLLRQLCDKLSSFFNFEIFSVLDKNFYTNRFKFAPFHFNLKLKQSMSEQMQRTINFNCRIFRILNATIKTTLIIKIHNYFSCFFNSNGFIPISSIKN